MELFENLIIEQKHNTALLSFSCGKDSIASFLKIKESGLFSDIKLFYYYLIPGLSWVENYIKYFENKFNTKILKLPSPAFYRMLSSATLFTPGMVAGCEKIQNEDDGFIRFNFSDLENIAKEYFGLSENTFTAIGATIFDSSWRRKALLENKGINIKSKKWYPIFNLNRKDIYDIIKKNNVQLPDDYKMFGLSFDGLDYRFLKIIQKEKPEDYKKIKYFFPLIDLVIFRHEKYYGEEIKKGRAYGWV